MGVKKSILKYVKKKERNWIEKKTCAKINIVCGVFLLSVMMS